MSYLKMNKNACKIFFILSEENKQIFAQLLRQCMGNFLVIDVSFKNPIHRKEFYEYTSNAFCMFSWLVKFEYLADGSSADCSNKILKYMLTCRLLEKNPQLQIAWKEKLVRFCWFPHEALECHRREPKKNTLFNLFMYTYWITDWLWKLPFRNKLMLTYFELTNVVL